MRSRDALFAEFLGTLLLVLVTLGSDIAASRAGGSEFQVLLANALATGFGISALILSLNPVSGACFNPLAAVLECVEGEVKWKHLAAYVLLQCGGALLGILLVHYLFGLPLLEVAAKPRSGLPMAVSEFVGTLGLLLVIHRVGNTRSQWAAYAVGAYLVAATWALPSTCIANPALTLARMFTDTYGGIRPSDALGFLLAQCLALAVIVAVIKGHKRFAVLGD
jgi:glycerol uptake facilitator-like aquaporin